MIEPSFCRVVLRIFLFFNRQNTWIQSLFRRAFERNNTKPDPKYVQVRTFLWDIAEIRGNRVALRTSTVISADNPGHYLFIYVYSTFTLVFASFYNSKQSMKSKGF